MRRSAFLITLAIAAVLGAAIASGELVQNGNLRLSFDGRFTPHTLPREVAVPVTVRLSGSITTTDGTRPPSLRRVSVAVNRYGQISMRGLPTCDADQLEGTTSQLALKRCKPALVGHGDYEANVDFPDRASIPVKGQILAFHGRVNGKNVIFMHVYGADPVRAAFVLTFKVSHRAKGTFGTVLTAKIPQLAADLGYVTNINLTFARRYHYAGESKSFLSAMCAAPTGFPGAIFIFARGSFYFAQGQSLETTVTRDCRVAKTP